MKLLFFASLAERFGLHEDHIKLDTKITIKVFFERYISRSNAKVRIENLLFAVNGEIARPETLISDNDTLAVLPPFSGGVD